MRKVGVSVRGVDPKHVFMHTYVMHFLGLSMDEYKHYVTNQYHPEHYGPYPKAGKYSGCLPVLDTEISHL